MNLKETNRRRRMEAEISTASAERLQRAIESTQERIPERPAVTFNVPIIFDATEETLGNMIVSVQMHNERESGARLECFRIELEYVNGKVIRKGIRR